MATADNRYRAWATIVYPESAPAGWKNTFDGFHLQGLISPLHDSDFDPETGERKKPHWHVLIRVSGKITEGTARGYFEQIGGTGCEHIGDIRAYARYMCHLDEPEGNGKTHYNTGDVLMFGGFDYFEVVKFSARDRAMLIAEMQEWCEDTHTSSYASLSRYARNNRGDWWRVLTTTQGANVMTAFLKSLTWETNTGASTVSDDGNVSV